MRVADFEVIVVNDGSTDQTAEVLEQLQLQYGLFLKVVTHPCNLGYGAALRSGFEASVKDWIFYTDGDGQYDPRELSLLLDAVDPQTSFVNGYKLQRNDPWHRIAIGFLYNRLARAAFRIGIRDIDCDFRLIKRDLVQGLELQSTSGTICLELVRKLELSGAKTAEVPVSHYPRLHGRSQFFRLRSLANTFAQLCAMFWDLTVRPAVRKLMLPVREFPGLPPAPPFVTVVLVASAILSLATLAYARALGLPLISDDYIQIDLGRHYGAFANWRALASDALYRCRATSIVMTYWTERLFGLSPLVFNASSLAVHILNSFLVFLLGLWRPIGWKISAIAAVGFAVNSHPQEAVIWYAALPELLVFTFAVGSFLCWVTWVQSRSNLAYIGSLLLFITALLSKESAVAVVPLMAAALMYEGFGSRNRLLSLMPFTFASIFYFGLAFHNRGTHLHFNDGTFSLAAPFWHVLINSASRLLWFWGAASVAALVFWRVHRSALLGWAGAWIVITLLPYSFLTYMPRVPSRHTYFATVGLSIILAAALLEFWKRTPQQYRTGAVGVLASAIAIHQMAYIWTKKHEQFLLRAAPTEQLISIVNRTSGPIYLKCFPYDESVAVLAVRYSGIPENSEYRLTIGGAAAGKPDALDLCNVVTGRGRF